MLSSSEVNLNESKITTLGTKALDPARTAREMMALDRETTNQFIINQKKFAEATLTEINKQQQAFERFANTIANQVTGAIMGMWDAMQHGENPMKALSDMISKVAEQLTALAIKAAIVAGIMALFGGADVAVAGAASGQATTGFFDLFKMMLGIPVTKNAAGGITNGPSFGLIGEAGPEAIMPLSKLGSMMNNTFNAGAMKANGNANGGQFVLRGQDLLVALSRTQKASNLKGQSISLA